MEPTIQIKDPDLARMALEALINTIEATGGVKRTRKGQLTTVCDEEWIDLADAYHIACQATGRELFYEQDPENDDEHETP